MLSVEPAALSSLASCTGHDVPFSDHEFASLDLHDLILKPEFESKPIPSIPIWAQSNQNVLFLTETIQRSPGSIESNTDSVYLHEPRDLDDRKLKRMKSNRESARRSRMQKQQLVDNLGNQVNRLSSANRELSNRLRFILHNGLIFRFENQRVQTERTMLGRRLIELQNLMIFQGIQQMHNHNNDSIA